MKNTTLSILALMVLAATAHAQGTVDIRIVVNRPGLHEVTWFDLAPVIGKRALDTESLELTRKGVEVPIAFRAVNGTRFDRASALQFHARFEPSRHSKQAVYRLRARPGKRRIRERALGSTRRKIGEAFVHVHLEEDLLFDPVATVQDRWLKPDDVERRHWFWARIEPEGEDATKSVLLRLEPPPRPVDRSPATMTLHLRSHLAAQPLAQNIEVELGGSRIGTAEWTAPGRVDSEFRIAADLLHTDNILALKNVSKATVWQDPGNSVRPTRRNSIMLDSVDVRYKTLLTGPTHRTPQIAYDVEVPGREGDGQVLLRFTNPGASNYRLYDVARSAWVRGHEIDLPAGRRARVVVCGSEGFYKPAEVSRWTARDLRYEADGASWVCITLDRFRQFIDPLVELREQQGLSTLVVSDREIYDAYAGGDFDPAAITRFLAAAEAGWKKKPRYVLLVGDADLDVDWVSQRRVLPTALVPTYYNGLSASDRALVPDSLPELAIGRLPARRADEVIRMVARTVDYETAAPGGAWRRRLNFIASEGRFGPMIDALIERYAARVLTEAIPAAYDVTMTYASRSSPYLYPPAEFNEKVIDRFNEGSLVFAYMGHGFARGFDRLRVGETSHPILTMNDLDAINSRETPPLAVIVACSTAQFDEPSEDAIAEELMRRTGGPLALVGGTRITHPFPNALMARALLSQVFDERKARVGDALTGAQLALLRDWKKDAVARFAMPLLGKLDGDRLMGDHRHLYVLFGDPAARLALPAPRITLETPERVQAGDSFVLRGEVEGQATGSLALVIELRRDRLKGKRAQVDFQDANFADTVRSNYDRANDKRLLSIETEVVDGKFDVRVMLPKDILPGAAVIKARLEEGGEVMVGSAPLMITTPEDAAPAEDESVAEPAGR